MKNFIYTLLFTLSILLFCQAEAGFTKVTSSMDTKKTPIPAEEIIQKLINTYAVMENYQSEAKYIGQFEIDGQIVKTETTMLIKLGKPNLYHINWKSQENQFGESPGTIWNAGKGAFKYTESTNTYIQISEMPQESCEMKNQKEWLNITEPLFDIFFNCNNTSSKITQFRLVGTDTINGEDNYILHQTNDSYKHTLWISKKDFLINRYKKEPLTEDLSIDALSASLIDSYEDMGIDLTEQDKSKINKFTGISYFSLNTSEFKNMHIALNFYNNLIDEIKDNNEFIYSLPENAQLKSSENIIPNKESMLRILKNLDGLNYTMLYTKGLELSEESVSDLEKELENDPYNFEIRLQIIGYYSADTDSEEYRRIKNKHILWIIENQPDYKEGSSIISSLFYIFPDINPNAYDKAKSLWLKQIELHKDNPVVLTNASKFFYLVDSELSKEILNIGKNIDPDNLYWEERLKFLNSLNPKDGIHKEYYVNGKLKLETEYKDGKYNGIYKTYYESGSLKFDGNVKNGVYHGMGKKYYENGQISFIGNFKEGANDGLYKFFHESGELMHTCTQQFKKEGFTRKDCQQYSSTGEIEKEYYALIYKQDKGTTLEKIFTNDHLSIEKIYDENGTIIKEKAYTNDGKLKDGINYNYYDTGKVHYALNYKKGIRKGVSKEYYENGSLKKEVSYTKTAKELEFTKNFMKLGK